MFIDLTNRKRAKKELVDKTRAESRLIEVYCGYLVVNKSDWALECNKNAMKINAHSVALLSSKKNIKIRTSGAQYGDPSSWSDNFNISAVGIAGCIELNNTEAHKKVNEIPAQLYLGIYTFDAPPPLIKSKVVYIMPRFMIRNNLGFPIYTRQVFKNQEFGKRILEIQDGQELQYQLENAKQSKTIQISRDCTD